jgi:hypothetical protein
MAENDIVALKELASGGFLEVALAPADIAAASASHAHAAADITSGVLDFDRIQQVLEVESDGTSGTPTEVDLTTNIVGGNLHALVVLLGADSEAYSKVVLPALGAAATGKVTVRVNEFEDASDDFVQIVLDDDTAIFPASGYTEMDPDEEFTFRWNDGRWDMDLRPNPSATTAVSIFKPNASGTIALTSDFAAPPAIGSTTPAAISGTTGTFTTLTATPPAGSTALTLTGGTVTASAPLISATQTWDDNAVTFTGLAATITNTASATASLVARFTVGITNVFEVDGRGFTTLRKVATTTDFVNMFTARRGATQVFAVRDDGSVNANFFSTNAGGGGSSFISDDGFAVRSSGSFRIASDTTAFSPDVYLRRDAAGVFAQYNGTNAQEYRVYGTFTSSTNYQRLAIKTKAVTLATSSGASVATTTGLIPDGAVLVGLTTRVSTAITGATGYDIGDGTDADRWGANIGIALNTSSDNRDWTAGTIECFTAAQEVTLTAVGPNFTGGAVVIVAHYLAGEAD